MSEPTGRDRPSYRRYSPLKADHPLVTDGDQCGLCRSPFSEGDETTLVPIVDDPQSEAGRTVRALPIHWRCLAGESHATPDRS